MKVLEFVFLILFLNEIKHDVSHMNQKEIDRWCRIVDNGIRFVETLEDGFQLRDLRKLI